MDEGSDSKAPRRKRVSRACDRCRSKKVGILPFPSGDDLPQNTPRISRTLVLTWNGKLRINAMGFVLLAQPVRLLVRYAHTTPTRRSAVYPKVTFGAWRSSGPCRSATSMASRILCSPSWAQHQNQPAGGTG